MRAVSCAAQAPATRRNKTAKRLNIMLSVYRFLRVGTRINRSNPCSPTGRAVYRNAKITEHYYSPASFHFAKHLSSLSPKRSKHSSISLGDTVSTLALKLVIVRTLVSFALVFFFVLPSALRPVNSVSARKSHARRSGFGVGFTNNLCECTSIGQRGLDVVISRWPPGRTQERSLSTKIARCSSGTNSSTDVHVTRSYSECAKFSAGGT